MHIEVHQVKGGSPVVYGEALEAYCKEHNQRYDWHSRMLREVGDKIELYLMTDEGTPVGSIILVDALDVHHGAVTQFAACWVSKGVSKRDTKTLFTAALSWCLFDKYQRSYHIDSTRQVIITKEVPKWVSLRKL